MKTYIGGSYSGKERISIEAKALKSLGFDVLSWWFDDDLFLEKAWDNDFSGDVAQTMAHVDFNQILQAEAFILDTIDKSSTGGSDTELGIALALSFFKPNLRLIHIGPFRNIFQNLVREHYYTWNKFKAKLKEQKQ
jgi:hypothetical protein